MFRDKPISTIQLDHIFLDFLKFLTFSVVAFWWHHESITTFTEYVSTFNSDNFWRYYVTVDRRNIRCTACLNNSVHFNIKFMQWRGNYSRTGGQNQRRQSLHRENWFFAVQELLSVPKISVVLQKKKKRKRSSPDLERLFDPETSVPCELWPRIKSRRGGKSRLGGAKISPGGELPPAPPPHFPRLWVHAAIRTGYREQAGPFGQASKVGIHSFPAWRSA